MNDTKRNCITELCEIISKLPKEEQLYLIGVGQGLLLASGGNDGKK